MFYIIEREFVGPDQEQHPDGTEIRIQTVPGRTNSSHEERTSGWLGTTNDWSEHAHGDYATLEEARAAIEERFGVCRERELEMMDFVADDTVVAAFRPGLYQPMSRAATADWIFSGLKDCVTADTTDDDIADLINEWELAVNEEGCTLDDSAEDMARKYRDELIAERDNDES